MSLIKNAEATGRKMLDWKYRDQLGGCHSNWVRKDEGIHEDSISSDGPDVIK